MRAAGVGRERMGAREGTMLPGTQGELPKCIRLTPRLLPDLAVLAPR